MTIRSTDFNHEISYIETWSQLSYQSVIFDSNVCTWNSNDSQFHTLISNRKEIAIVIENEDTTRFGCFIYANIDTIDFSKENNESYYSFSDPKSFIFTFYNGNPSYFGMVDEFKNDKTFTVYNPKHNSLFSIGKPLEREISINVQGSNSKIHYPNTPFYTITPSTVFCKKRYGDCINVKRLLVLQFGVSQ